MKSGFTKKQPTILQTDRRRQIELSVLQLEAGATGEEINTQFRLLAKQGHPDTSCVGHQAQHNVSLQNLREAKDWLLKDLEGV